MGYEKEIIKILGLPGANRLCNGYNYIIYGLVLLLENDGRTLNIIKSLYIDIAKHYNTSWNCVEKNIRYMVKSIWTPLNDELLMRIFNKSASDQRPVNKEFFNKMYEYISGLTDKVDSYNGLSIICPISHAYCKAFTGYCVEALKMQGKL